MKYEIEETQTQTQTDACIGLLKGIIKLAKNIARKVMGTLKISEEQYSILRASIQGLSDVVSEESMEIASKLEEVIQVLKSPDVDLSAQIDAIAEIKSRVEALSDNIAENPIPVPEVAVTEK